MRKKEFMEQLENNLRGLSKEDIEEILEDYEEHFNMGKKNKRKETEIAKSLGNPEKIAEEAKEELGEPEEISFLTLFKSFWTQVEKTTRKVWKNVKREIPKAEDKIRNLYEELEKKGKKTKTKKEKRKAKRSAWKIVLLVMLNLFIMLWLMISFYAVIFSLFISGISIIISGIATLIVGLFILINPVEFMTRNMALSALFAGIGLTALGWLWSALTLKLGKGLSWIVSKYIKATARWTKR